ERKPEDGRPTQAPERMLAFATARRSGQPRKRAPLRSPGQKKSIRPSAPWKDFFFAPENASDCAKVPSRTFLSDLVQLYWMEAVAALFAFTSASAPPALSASVSIIRLSPQAPPTTTLVAGTA